MRQLFTIPFLCILILTFIPVLAKPADIFSDSETLLPPAQSWSGRSESLMTHPDDAWITPAERTGLSATPDYDETMAWLVKLVAAAPELEMVSIGKS